jgi:hypothetical protein
MKNVDRRQFVTDIARGSLLLTATTLGAGALKAQSAGAGRSCGRKA